MPKGESVGNPDAFNNVDVVWWMNSTDKAPERNPNAARVAAFIAGHSCWKRRHGNADGVTRKCCIRGGGAVNEIQSRTET
jgi:hypothetical protein